MGGLTDKIKGKFKEITGVAKGDRSLEAEGKKDEAKGEIKEKFEDAKESIRDTIEKEKAPERR
jgi:uncharacterized protein YjbJ (UPF0337 family)